jgi:hypothetical protein
LKGLQCLIRFLRAKKLDHLFQGLQSLNRDLKAYKAYLESSNLLRLITILSVQAFKQSSIKAPIPLPSNPLTFPSTCFSFQPAIASFTMQNFIAFQILLSNSDSVLFSIFKTFTTISLSPPEVETND